MGNLDVAGDRTGRVDRDAVIGLLDRTEGIGLAGTPRRRYRIHPALPWYSTTLFTTS
jgi:hypothetical protein